MERTPGQKFTVRHDSPLLKYLYEVFPDQSKTGVKGYLTNGQVIVNDKGVTAFDQPLFEGDTLVILPKGVSKAREVKSSAKDIVTADGVKILFEDAHLLVVDKPSGLGMSSAPHARNDKKATNERTLFLTMTDYVKTTARAEREEAKHSGIEIDRSPAKVWNVNRLDRGTSGIVIFAKDEHTKDLLLTKWKNMVLEQTYIGIIEGHLHPSEGTIQTFLKENEKTMGVNSYDVETDGAQIATTSYKTIASSEKYSEVEFHLETTRKHQIRVHCQVLGHPIAGDKKYGGLSSPAGRLALHESTLVFRHPYTDQVLRFSSKRPKEFSKLV